MKHLAIKKNKKVIKFYWQYLQKFKLLFLLQIIMIGITLLLRMYWSYLLGCILDSLALNLSKDIIIHQVYHFIYILITIELGIIILSIILDRLYPNLSTKILKLLIDDSFAYLQKHSFNFFNKHLSGALITRMQQLENSLETILDIFNYSLINLFWKILFTISILFYFNWLLGLIVLIWLSIFLIINSALTIYKIKFEEAMTKSHTKLGAELTETITGNINLKLFDSFDYELNKFKKLTSDRRKKILKVWNLENKALNGQTIAMAFLEILTIYLSIKLWSIGAITLGITFVIQAYIFSLYGSIWGFGNSIRRIFESLTRAQEMVEHLQLEHEVKDVKNAKKLKINKGSITFKNISFAYEKKSKGILHKFNLQIEPKQKIALIGPSGGGKSTIIKLLLRLFDPQQGKILIDGQDISQVSQGSLRKNIALVPQDPILFNRSIKENIAYGQPKITMKEIIKASKIAMCHDFIMKTPKKYNTLVGEKGIKLSGGQKQRIAIARAILTKAPILIFDEATSSLDSESELSINKAIKNITKNKTTIMIAHRLSTIMQADRIFVIKNGHIIEKGNHKELLKKDSGLYKKLWSLQSGGYIEK